MILFTGRILKSISYPRCLQLNNLYSELLIFPVLYEDQRIRHQPQLCTGGLQVSVIEKNVGMILF